MSEENLYKILGVKSDATSEDIKRAYRKISLTSHPDKGGDAETYKKINTAYQVLSDPKKRELYDSGENPEENNRRGFSEDLFNNIFGQFFGGNIFEQGNSKTKNRKTTPAIHDYKVTLENLCTKKIGKLRISRGRLCECTSGGGELCRTCKGTGIKVKVTQSGHFIQQMQEPCKECKGIGKIYNFCDKCKNGTIRDSKIFEVPLSPEISDGHIFAHNEEGNHELGKTPGDFIIRIRYEKHPKFTLMEDNISLLYNLEITLKESLLGYGKEITHPSGEIIPVVVVGKISCPDEEITLPNKGLTSRGSLVIKIKVIFPDILTDEQKNILQKFL